MELYYTVGPSSENLPVELISAGATGARLTFSFGTPDFQWGRARVLKASAAEAGRHVQVVADLEGSKPRLGEFVIGGGDQSVIVSAGTELRIVNSRRVDIQQGTQLSLPIPDERVFSQIKKGNRIIIGDGSALLEVTSASGHAVVAIAEFDCEIEGRRGFYVQGAPRSEKALTPKDVEVLKYVASRAEFDAVAVSFVATREDIREARQIMRENGLARPIIAKIETAEGVENIDAICAEADSIMVARGDLALTGPWEHMPDLSDRIVEASIRAGKPWIMATQVADGLNHYALMTRAEMCDLWHWANKGAAGVLLSRETAWGPRPVDAVSAVNRLLRYAARA